MNGTRSPLITPVRAAFLDALLVRARERFPELRQPLTWSGFRRAAERIGLTVALRPFPADAQALGYLLWSAGRWTVVIDEAQSDAARAVIGAHELAHHMAHRPEGLDDADLIIYDRSPEWYGDIKEAEADYLAELLIAGPRVVKTRPKSMSKIYHTDQETARQLRFLDDDPDEAMLRDVARSAAREDAANTPVGHGRVQFALPRAAWTAISLAGASVPFPHYTNVMTGPDFELVTATLETASLMVELLARAGYKRTAVYVRRTIREAADSYEVREQHRAHVIREGAKRVAAASETWVTTRRTD